MPGVVEVTRRPGARSVDLSEPHLIAEPGNEDRVVHSGHGSGNLVRNILEPLCFERDHHLRAASRFACRSGENPTGSGIEEGAAVIFSHEKHIVAPRHADTVKEWAARTIPQVVVEKIAQEGPSS